MESPLLKIAFLKKVKSVLPVLKFAHYSFDLFMDTARPPKLHGIVLLLFHNIGIASLEKKC